MGWLTANSGMIGLLFFFVFFTAVALWLMRPGAKRLYGQCAQIPFEESENE